jgi:hypothetical protein
MLRMLSIGLAMAFLTSTLSVQAGEECPIETAMGKLPKMTYKVGGEEVCCPQAATKLAKESDAAMTFLVAKKEFTDKQKATMALVEATEKFVDEFSTPCKCEVSGKVSIAGTQVCCDTMAAATAKVAKEAMKKVHMTYMVGEKACACPIEAASLAKSSGKEKLFVINGEKTACNVTARLNLARAKYKAAVTALAKAEQKSEKEDTKS